MDEMAPVERWDPGSAKVRFEHVSNPRGLPVNAKRCRHALPEFRVNGVQIGQLVEDMGRRPTRFGAGLGAGFVNV